MKKEYALVENGVVTNVIQADEAFILAQYDHAIVIKGRIPHGWHYKEGVFASPHVITPDADDFVPTMTYRASKSLDTGTVINIVITSAKINDQEQNNDYRLKFALGSTTQLVFELHDEVGNLIPLSGEAGHFAVPLQRLKGEVIDSLGIQFMDGVATLITTWDQSG